MKYRGVYHDRLDAPFVGSLIFAYDCHHQCPGCCHGDRHTTKVYEATPEEIIQTVLDYGFSEGIILGGFEWTEQYQDLLDLLHCATEKNLRMMLYTHYDECEMRRKFPELYTFHGLYIKYGEYRRDLHEDGYTSMGIPLASTNQYIKEVP